LCKLKTQQSNKDHNHENLDRTYKVYLLTVMISAPPNLVVFISYHILMI